MENKKNYVDGIDVSECEYANACDKKLKCVILQDDVCETKPYCEGYNCYYKQLKHKEQECEVLERTCNELRKRHSEDTTKLSAEVQELKAECEELKKENDILRQYRGSKQASYEEMQKCWQVSEQARRKLEKENNKLKTENEKLKKDIAIYKGIIDSDKEENERLKEEITKLSDPRYQISKVNEGYYNRMNTYKQALQEIREYCEEQNLKADYTACEIIDKINEVIGVEE